MAREKEIDGVPVIDVPPNWIGRIYPILDEDTKPLLHFWARHPNGTLTPVYQGAILPRGAYA
jgi:hypothetical protein